MAMSTWSWLGLFSTWSSDFSSLLNKVRKTFFLKIGTTYIWLACQCLFGTFDCIQFFSNLVWFHSICLWLLLMVIFTSNSRRLQILCWEIVNPRISQSEEFVTEFPCFHQICESPAHRLVQLLSPINKYIGEYISFSNIFLPTLGHVIKTLDFYQEMISDAIIHWRRRWKSHLAWNCQSSDGNVFSCLSWVTGRYRLCLDSERNRPTFQKIACCSSWSLLPIDN